MVGVRDKFTKTLWPLLETVIVTSIISKQLRRYFKKQQHFSKKKKKKTNSIVCTLGNERKTKMTELRSNWKFWNKWEVKLANKKALRRTEKNGTCCVKDSPLTNHTGRAAVQCLVFLGEAE